MKKVPIILCIIVVTIVLAGCTGTTTVTDPIVGNWQDSMMGVSQMEFGEDHHYHAGTLDITYDGNWSKIDTDRYQADFMRSDNNTTLYSVIVDYDPINQTIYIDNTPDIKYGKISDMIIGNWTDQLKRSEMQFLKGQSWHMLIGNASYDGNWSKINDTAYVIDYSDHTNMSALYRELVFYNRSDNVIQLDNLSNIFYTKSL